MEVAHAPSSGIPTVARTAASPRKPPSPKRLANRVAKGSPRSAARDPSHHTKTSKSGRPNIAPRPLVPFTERKSVDDRGSRKPSKDADGLDKSDVIPDGGSAGREGRQFTVAKVGNNGRLYLRPTIRPAHQRHAQPNFQFPVTPPATATLEKTKTALDAESDLLSPTTPRAPRIELGFPQPSDDAPSRPPLPTHRRALSDSTVHDRNSVFNSDASGFRIAISKPSHPQRPRSAEDGQGALPHLDIRIPSWRIGVPRFTSAGTPLLQPSSYAPSYSDDARSLAARSIAARSVAGRSVAGRSFAGRSVVGTPLESSQEDDETPPLPILGPRKSSTLNIPRARLSNLTPTARPSLHGSSSRSNLSTFQPRTPHPLRSTFISTRITIQPSMFDDLTTPPACDDRSVVRYAPGTGAVTAATPARLVAEITSPSFLDYELISDFFLTYRAFLDPEDLLRMLIARLRWAITRDDEVGMIVHVRGFVAMRHWVLNYFIDDFLIDYGLRLEFCKLLNGLVEDLNHESRPHKIQLKALNEMKKCWRRVCSQYWDGDEFDENIRPEEPITPGGAAGDRNSKSIPAFWEDAAPTRVGNLVSVPESTAANFASSQPLQGRTSEAARGQRPSTPDDAEAAEMEREFGPFSPASQASLDVISCSFPLKQLRSLQAHSGRAVGAHPVSTSPVSRAGPVATTPRALMGKRVRPTHPRERSSSLPENVIEEPAEEAAGEDADKYVLVLPPGASLVRGDVLPPGHAYVQMAPGAGKRQTTVFYPNGVGRRRQNLYPDGMAGLGVKKFIGSVRRVLSTRGQNGPEDFPDQYMGGVVPGRYGNPVARLPGTAVVPLDRTGLGGAPPRLRIDVLAAKVSEEFKAAVREDAREEAGSQASSSNETELPENQRDTVNTRAASQDFHSLLNVPKARPTSDGALTGRSKSIIIVDDTYPSDSPLAHGGFMTCNPSVEAFADALMRSGAEITPPMTPPANERVAAARRSSYLLNEHLTSDPSVESLPRQLTADPSMESLPPFVPDWDTMGRHSGVPSTVDGQRMSHATFATHHSSPQRARRPPPVSGALHKMHQRNKSSRTRHSFSSAVSRPANASFSTGIVPPSNTQSIAGTSYTRYSAAESDAHASMPKPLRMLRRRPGGDLRAATNVDDLDQRGLRRSRSLGSLATFSDSMLSSQMYSMRRASTENFGSVLSGELPRGSDFFSVGQLAGNNDTTTHRLSVHGTFSSRPAMRPSFEADAERLAQIPDDGDDGGVESALLKLEGKYEGPSPKPASTFEEKATPPMSPPNEDIDRDDSYESSEMTSVDSNELLPPRVFEDESLDHADTPGGSAMRGLSFLTTDSYDDEEYYEESYKSTPLLDGGNTEDGESKHEEQEQEQEQEQEHQEAEEEETADWNHRSILTDGVDTPPNVEEAPAAESQRTSFEFVHTTEALGITQPGQTTPPPPDTDLEATPRPAKKERPESHKVEEAPATEGEHNAEAESFFDSDLSSELSEEDAEPDMPIRSPLQGGLPVQTMPTLGLPSPPNSHSRKLGQDTTQAPAGSPGYAAMTDIYQKPLPLTPDETPAEATPRPSAAGSMAEVTPYSIHLPFVLAFDSETLAQQFTLIEKDALNEIDWKELVDMDWRKAGANQHSRSWVDFLRNTDAQGVEVVIARFNLVVKWAVSQVVLTRSLEERARCVVKLIHVAACCRRYRNFATLAQLAIALSSPEVSRLERTWALVPAVDTAAFRDLEALVSPTRNFFNIRVEMESGPPDLPCIPFVGIYTHDLLYNAQRPSEVASSPTTAPLVNFERCRIAAGVIKTLLRLLEASSRFSFQPLEGVTERCLWIGALADDEIRRYSAALV